MSPLFFQETFCPLLLFWGAVFDDFLQVFALVLAVAQHIVSIGDVAEYYAVVRRYLFGFEQPRQCRKNTNKLKMENGKLKIFY